MSSNNSNAEFWTTVASTFMASIKSVGTACTLAAVGVYLHQRGFVVGNGKRTLALISQQVTIPLLFFTKILYCNQDWSPDPCPNVTDSLRDVWILLLWPIWVCTAGILVGYGVTVIAKVPHHQRNAILASVAFGNSTGLPITLLTVIHANFGSSSKLGTVDPTLFLSVYLVTYPVLQWGIGGMLLAPPPEKKKGIAQAAATTPMKRISIKDNGGDDNGDEYEDIDHEMEAGIIKHQQISFNASIRKSITAKVDKTEKTLAHNVINCNQKMSQAYKISHRGLYCTDASMYWSVQENLDRWGKPRYGTASTGSYCNSNSNSNADSSDSSRSSSSFSDEEQDDDYNRNNNKDNDDDDEHHEEHQQQQQQQQDSSEASALLGNGNGNGVGGDANTGKYSTNGLINKKTPCDNKNHNDSQRSITSTSSLLSFTSEEDKESIIGTILIVLKRCFQPPVIAALAGLFFASFPSIRGILVDIDDRNGSAPLQWFFDGLFEVGRAAVPINMIILGCNLSASYMLDPVSVRRMSSMSNVQKPDAKFFTNQASMLVVIGKMIVMPIVGVTSTFLLSKVYVVPQEIAGGLYLVLLIVFLCPTANNVMVMVELASGSGGGSGGGGGGSKESLARIIAYQYAVAPIVLSLTVTGAVLMASSMAE